MHLQDFYLNKIIEFIRRESPEIYKLFSPSSLRNRIKQHMDYNTIVCIWDKSDLVSVCVFNINKEICDVHHAIVGKKYRNKSLLRRMVYEGYLRYPFVKFIKFDRELKYTNRKEILIPIEKFLRRGI